MSKLFWFLCQIGCIIGMLLNIDNDLWVLYVALFGVTVGMMVIDLDDFEE